MIKIVVFSYAINVELDDNEIAGKDDVEIDNIAQSKAEKIWDEVNPKPDEMNVDIEDGD